VKAILPGYKFKIHKMKKLIFTAFIIIGLTNAFTQELAYKIYADFLIKNVNIVDVENGAVLAGKYVAMRDSIIIGIYDKEVSLQNSGEVVDGTNKYLIPGLWDMHTHFCSMSSFSNPLLIANGVTGVREMFGVIDTVKKIRAETSAGTLIAPDIYSSGLIIDGIPPIWPFSSGVKNGEEAGLEVAKQKNEGVDFIKVYSRLSKESYMAIAQKSIELNIPFAGHLPENVTIWDAIYMNQQSIEHLYGILEACTGKPDEFIKITDWIEKTKFLVNTFDKEIFDSLCTALAKSNTWICPTLIVLKNVSYKMDSTVMQDPRLKYMPKQVQQMWDPRSPLYRSFQDRFPALFELQNSLIDELSKHGVKLIAGTDFPNPFCYPGFSIHDELQLLVKGGMSPAMALKCATLNPARFMGKENVFGKVAAGQLSSLVLLDKNPLEDISNTKSIHAVFLRGRYLNRAMLDKLLEEAENISSKIKSPY
jgi:cytosine/adenosine deaminase-related metal-dependent hydrolase